MSVDIYIYIYIYIYINQELSQWDYPILRPERDSQDQELFLAPSTDKQISNYDRVLKPLSIPITIKHQDWAAACSRIHMFVWQNMLNQILRSSIVRIPPSPPPPPFLKGAGRIFRKLSHLVGRNFLLERGDKPEKRRLM